MGRVLTPYRAGVTTDGLKHNKYRSHCFGRGACDRRAGGCDIHAAFDSPTGLIYPAMDTGNLTLRTNRTVHEVTVDQETGKAQRRRFHRHRDRRRSYEARPRSSSWRASTLESARLLLLSKSPHAPNGIGKLQRPRRSQLLRARHGARRHGPRQGSGREAAHARRRPARRLLPPALPQSQGEALRLRSRLRVRGWQWTARCFPDSAMAPGFGASYKKTVRDYAGAFIGMGALRRSAGALRKPRRPSTPR